jgi:hypothetical protein
MEYPFEASAGHFTAEKRCINSWCLVPSTVPRYAFNMFGAPPEESPPGANMTDRNRSFGAALGIVVMLIAVAALAAMLAP